MRIDRIITDIAKAKEKIAEWQARLRDLERQKTEHENLEILQAVRGMATTPEEIRDLLDLLKATKEPQTPTLSTNIKEEPKIEEE